MAGEARATKRWRVAESSLTMRGLGAFLVSAWRGSALVDQVALRELIGVPFLNKGRSVRGADCWGIFEMVQKIFGNAVPEVVDVSAFSTSVISEKMREQLIHWHRVEVPQPGDAVTMALDPKKPEVEQHFGVYIGHGKFIHTLTKTGSMFVAIDHPFWKNRIRGFYRWAG